MIKFFFRLDDIAPNMNWDNFNLAVEILKKNNIKPLIAVIPDVRDPKLLNYPANSNFWPIMRELKGNGWIIAQHGYQHLASGSGGILQIHKSGEFGGLDFEKQEIMISAGRKIMEAQAIIPDVFVAPRHSLDKNTLKALKQNHFHFVSDGIALWPFKKWGLILLPQILWRPRKGMFGLVTIALHTNTMSINDITNLEKFMGKNRKNIGDFSELMEWHKKTGFIKKFSLFFINKIFKVFWYSVFYLKFKLFAL
ncbi:MAG: DUF2334 domain-containing protein [Parcubacteria group bacterium]|nr:DUF2334 domain-containing protein [Parcubacteria group bacterium]